MLVLVLVQSCERTRCTHSGSDFSRGRRGDLRRCMPYTVCSVVALLAPHRYVGSLVHAPSLVGAVQTLDGEPSSVGLGSFGCLHHGASHSVVV